MPNLKYFIYPYMKGSKSTKNLAEALEAKIIKREGSKFKPKSYKKIINWGSSECPYDSLNPREAVSLVSNKLEAFKLWSNPEGVDLPRIPNFTTDLDEAHLWLRPQDNSSVFRCAEVVARKTLTGHSGSGIILIDRSRREELPEAPLYVEYVPKDKEYRVHVFNGEVIDVQRKVRDPSREPSNWKVRSHHNGFIFQRSNVEAEEDVLEQAKRAVASSGLLFAGVDVIWNEHRQKAYVLEANTAPGLEGLTVEIYADAFRNYLEEIS